MLSIRDPVHGFIRADDLEAALIASRPLQRLRFVHQLGFTFLVFPGAEHSRFSHALGAMHLAGRVYEALAGKSEGMLPADPRAPERRLVRAAALLHDLGHAPFSHSAEELFASGIDHEQMTRRLIAAPEIAAIFARHGAGLEMAAVERLLEGGANPTEQLLAQIISGELDVDKMDYLLRDSLYCGVRYGSYDLERLLDTMLPLLDPDRGEWGIGVDEGGVHALEALVMARYYMFTQVYFNVTGKALELHLNQWLQENGVRWAAEPEAFLAQDDISVWSQLRQSSSLHARAVVVREHFPVAFETREHLTPEEKERFEALLPDLYERFGRGNLLLSNSAKDPHRMGRSRVRLLVRRFDGSLEPMEEASQFIRHLARIDRYRVYTPPPLREPVGSALREIWG
ncbi:MAG TPA: HD domain-containing protein [Thermoanaerobaculia bacterium]|nr:HD domain-containing protein [Thermoanaerobaculia bacterium]